MADSDLLLLEAVLERLQTTVAGVRAGQFEDPTPCSSWNVQRLLEHLVSQVLSQFTVVAAGGQPDWSVKQPRLAGDWYEEAHDRSAALLAAWAAAPEELHARLPMQLAELITHTWDLAAATGQDAQLPDDAAEQGLGWARGMLKDEYRGSEADGKAFGPEVNVPADAPAHQRLVAWFGRDPAWGARVTPS